MRNFTLYVCLLIAFFGVSSEALATHNRAGEISVEPIGECTDLRIRATITTYTKTSSVAADRDTLTICWGDGICEKVVRSNGNGQQIGPPSADTKVNYYEAIHVYPANGTYLITMTDPNRNGGIVNVNAGSSSENVPFHLQTSYTFLNCQFDGPNTTPILYNLP